SIEEIRAMLSTRAKMVFITVGMGGGTGTGAAPVIAKIAKELDLLTVGIVTIPFSFEGKMRSDQAQKGIEKLREHIDSLVVINNNKLREVYGNLGFKAGFSKADEVLSTAATGIAEVITHHYTQNIDLKDAKTVLSNSGTAIMGSAVATGQNRAQEAITKALDSPLLNDNKINGARNVLLLIVSGSTEITIDEIGEINDYIQSEAKSNVDIIMGVGEDDELGEAIAVTVIATGFNKEQQLEISNTESKKIIHDLVEEVPGSISTPVEESVVRHSLDVEELDEEDVQPTAENINKIDVVYDEVDADMTDDFVIKPMMAEKEVVEEEYEEENQITLTFDLPLTSKNKIDFKGESMTQELASHIRDIEVIDPVHIKPFQTVDGKIKHGLEDFMDDEIKQQEQQAKTEVEDEELKFNVRVENKADKQDSFKDDEDESPLNLTIAQLQNKADDRRRKMKDFNYRFINRVNKNIDEIENQPAYKRMGVDLEDVEPSSEVTENKSRISLSSDDNDDIQLRSNNSYLHDNVD
ncbi:MAG: cell division FtsZ family protein, partial [Flavobacteriaceae bacterium]|nr:cell division FtsZ family protein [Flavobacteriaceae bacterium]